MINPIYLAVIAPQSPVPGCGPQHNEQALIHWHGGAALGLGRL